MLSLKNWIHEYAGLFFGYVLPEFTKKNLIKNFELVLKTPYIYVFPLLKVLKNHSAFKFKVLTDIICCDFLNKKYRYTVIYHLLSTQYNLRLRIATEIKETDNLFTVTSLFKGSNWLEREVWDLYGVFFENHPDLKKILNDYTYAWNPLKKDFPLTGHVELAYDDLHQKLSYSKVELTQEFREFISINTWNKF